MHLFCQWCFHISIFGVMDEALWKWIFYGNELIFLTLISSWGTILHPLVTLFSKYLRSGLLNKSWKATLGVVCAPDHNSLRGRLSCLVSRGVQKTTSSKHGILNYRTGDADQRTCQKTEPQEKGKETNCLGLVVFSSNSRNSVVSIRRKCHAPLHPRCCWLQRSSLAQYSTNKKWERTN